MRILIKIFVVICLFALILSAFFLAEGKVALYRNEKFLEKTVADLFSSLERDISDPSVELQALLGEYREKIKKSGENGELERVSYSLCHQLLIVSEARKEYLNKLMIIDSSELTAAHGKEDHVIRRSSRFLSSNGSSDSRTGRRFGAGSEESAEKMDSTKDRLMTKVYNDWKIYVNLKKPLCEKLLERMKSLR